MIKRNDKYIKCYHNGEPIEIYKDGKNISGSIVKDGPLTINDKLVYWNQLLEPNPTISETSAATLAIIPKGVQIVKNHKYYYSVYTEFLNSNYYIDIYTIVNGTKYVIMSLNGSNSGKISRIITSNYSGISNGTSSNVEGNIWIYLYNASKSKHFQLVDLTEAFGAGKEPTIEEFETMFPKTYYPFSPVVKDCYEKQIRDNAVTCDIEMLGGKSLVFNQNVQRYAVNSTASGVNITLNSDGSINLHGTLTETPAYNSFLLSGGSAYKRDGRPYIFCINNRGGYNFGLSGYPSVNADYMVWSNSAGTDWTGRIYLYTQEGDSLNIDNLNCNSFDAKVMFGVNTTSEVTEEMIQYCMNLTQKKSYPLTQPKIVSADVESVDLIGRNRFDKNAVTDNTWLNDQGIDEPASSYCVSDYIPVDAGVAYLFGNRGTSRTMFYDASKRVINPGTWGTGGVSSRQTFVVPSGASYVRCAVTKILRDAFFVIRQGTERDEYTPFKFESIPIPAAIHALPGYGWSAWRFNNHVDFTRKTYVQKVGRIVFDGSDVLAFNTSSFGVKNVSMKPKTNIDAVSNTANIIAPGYVRSTDGSKDKAIRCVNKSSFYLYDNDFTNKEDAVDKLNENPIICYVEINPIETDISALLDDSFNDIEVETGGTITFNQSGDVPLPVPNREEYLIEV